MVSIALHDSRIARSSIQLMAPDHLELSHCACASIVHVHLLSVSTAAACASSFFSAAIPSDFCFIGCNIHMHSKWLVALSLQHNLVVYWINDNEHSADQMIGSERLQLQQMRRRSKACIPHCVTVAVFCQSG